MRKLRKLLLYANMAFFIGMLAGGNPSAVRAEKESGMQAESAKEAGAESGRMMVDPFGNGDGYAAVLYDNRNGLPTCEANAIIETSDGFLWIGSYSGLIRYDGNTFERMDSTTGITSVTTLFEDSRKRLWVGTNDNGVAVMDKGKNTMFSMENGLSSDTIRSVVETEDGLIYIATTKGVAVVDGQMQIQLVDDERLNNEYVRRMERGPDDILYGVTMDGAVFTIENRTVTGFCDLSRLGVEESYFVYPDPAQPGYVYLGTMGSELLYGKMDGDFSPEKRINVSPLEQVHFVRRFGEQLWVCADNGIGVLKNDHLEQPRNIPLNSAVEDVMADYQGNLWFISSRQGVMKLVTCRFTDIFARNSLETASVNTTCLYNGQLFMGCNNGLMILGDDRRIEKCPLKSAVRPSGGEVEADDLIKLLAGCKIRSIIRDSRNRLWISNFSEYPLIRYENGTAVCYGMLDGLPSARVRTVWEREDGSFLAACTGGVALIRENGVEKVYGEEMGISNTEVLTVLGGENGDILLGTDGGGIYVIHEDAEEAVHLGKKDGLHSEVIMRIKKDLRRDIYWIVTSNSISFMDSDYQITTVEHFPYSNNFDLYQSAGDDLWILSSNGIYQVSPEEMMENGEVNPVFYGIDDGLPCIATANSYSEYTEDGDLYMAGSTGVAKFNPDREFESVMNVRVAFPYVAADGMRIYPNGQGQIILPSDVGKLTIYSNVCNYALSNPNVDYFLEGFDKKGTTVKWSEFGPVDYTNLGGGEYHYQVTLRDSEGVYTYELPIIKEKAFYEHVWFHVVMLVIFAVFIAEAIRLYIHIKTRKYLKKQEEDKELIREIVQAFAKTIDMKDAYTNGHSSRVADYTVMLARELGYDEETVEKFHSIAMMHDIGKIGVPPEVLNKPGKLTDEEFQTIKSHAALGYDVLKDISIMPELAIGAGAHHERPDGKGYPKGLKGDEIPRVAQIIAVADTFDAMYSNRPYRKRMNFEKAVSIIRDAAGTQLTADVVDAFLRLVEKGQFRAPDDHGGGTVEDISNIHESYNKQEKA